MVVKGGRGGRGGRVAVLRMFSAGLETEATIGVTRGSRAKALKNCDSDREAKTLEKCPGGENVSSGIEGGADEGEYDHSGRWGSYSAGMRLWKGM